MKYNKAINLVLGTSMFVFGFLKFFHPFKDWYSVQITASNLGETSYVLGITGELVVGLTFLILTRVRQNVSFQFYALLSAFASVAVIVMMSTAIYVHLQPGVPAEVLPLKIKLPVIPLSFLVIAAFNLTAVGKHYILSKPGIL